MNQFNGRQDLADGHGHKISRWPTGKDWFVDHQVSPVILDVEIYQVDSYSFYR